MSAPVAVGPVGTRGSFGVEVDDLDPVGDPVSSARRLRALLDRHRLVVARLDAPLPPGALVELGRALGPLVTDPTRRDADDPPEVVRVLTDERTGRPAAGASWPAAGLPWHQDHSGLPEPAAVSVLVPVELAPDGSGVTSFVDLVGALDRLDPDDAERLRRATVTCDLAPHLAATYGLLPGRLRVPMVVRHPRLGVELPWLGPSHAAVTLDGVPAPGGWRDEVLDRVVRDAPRIDHHWSPADLVVFDNLAVLHGRGRVTSTCRREMAQVSTRVVGGLAEADWRPSIDPRP